MLSLRPIRRFCHAATTVVSIEFPAAASNKAFNPKELEEPALVKLKAERDPEKLFHLFKANAHDRIVIENRFAFEDTVSRLAGARRFDYIEHLLEHQKTLPQGRREGFIVRIIMLYGLLNLSMLHLVLTLSRDIRAVKDFFTEVPLKFDIVLDVFSINIIIKAFCEMAILDKAYLVMVEMGKATLKWLRGFILLYIPRLSNPPNIKIYQTMIHYLCKEGDYGLAYTMCKHCMQKNWFPNVLTIHALLEVLKKNGQLGKAKAIITLAQIPPFSSKQTGALKSILSRRRIKDVKLNESIAPDQLLRSKNVHLDGSLARGHQAGDLAALLCPFDPSKKKIERPKLRSG
ncbi:Pentatricopeptide repeat [Trema orientale]|uniref:Pentatricopeptide repeat n=1 Tax=Trema orientale TaxID=63057 RepID=A0A2P5EX71_TREOI|nr:Pentatricopeptide repeat [Trema orientale]